jgi:NAD(P)-dependent dehydrogenase (short-subunit alcohol dehydrogenase family)
MQLDIRPTALQVITGHDLHGRCAIVTGGASGIGAETVRALATVGARVIIATRDASKAEPVAAALRTDTGNPSIMTATLDLASLRSVRSFVARFLADREPLHLLINNAGLVTRTLARTKDGFEVHFGVNHLGHFALTMGLLPALRAAGNARVVSLISVAHQQHDIHFDDPNFHQRPYEVWPAYGQSKTANALFTVGLMQHHATDGLTANAVHPGGILTSAWKEFSREDLIKSSLIDASSTPHPDFRSPEQGAATTVWAATAPELEGVGGRYLEDCAIASETPDVMPEGRRWPPGSSSMPSIPNVQTGFGHFPANLRSGRRKRLIERHCHINFDRAAFGRSRAAHDLCRMVDVRLLSPYVEGLWV